MTSTIRVTQTVDITPAAREALAAYKAVQQPALAAYKAVQESALAAYRAVEQPAWAAYEAVQQPARAAYRAVQESARAALKNVHPALDIAARSYPHELSEVVSMLPCTLDVLDAHADDAGWCGTWTQLRDDAISEGLLVVVEAPAAVTA